MKLYSNIIGLSLALLCASPMLAQESKKTNNQRSYTQALDVIGASMSLLDRYFVDSVDLEKISRRGIDAMLSSLDPYTEYYSKEDADQLKLITTGEYGGIGSIISQRADSTVIINDPMEGMPAAVAGLKAGDRILEVDGKDFRHARTNEVSEALKGRPGSKITLLVQRMGESKPRKVEFVRRKIVVSPVPYFGTTPQGYGYIKLTNFPNTATAEVTKALNYLMKERQIKGLVLDLRDNVGGLMDEAVKIVSLFVPEGTEVLHTKGRAGLKQEAIYRTRSKPIALDLPLTILIDGESASSAEIVAGALQDVDRAVVVGQKSFGKGLIQTTMQLPHEGVLKLTTAKYYIPSGRCIQRVDYAEARAGRGAKVLPDSLTKVFYTKAGREVHDAGGILPDVLAKNDSLPTMLYYLTYNEPAFDWITAYCQRHKSIAPAKTFEVTEADYEDFGRMLVEKKFDYDRQSAKRLEALREIAKLEGYLERAKPLLDSLEQAFVPDLKHDLQSLRPQILRYLNTSIINRYYYRRGVIERELLSDEVVAEAERILSDPKRYRSILEPKRKLEEKKDINA